MTTEGPWGLRVGGSGAIGRRASLGAAPPLPGNSAPVVLGAVLSAARRARGAAPRSVGRGVCPRLPRHVGDFRRTGRLAGRDTRTGTHTRHCFLLIGPGHCLVVSSGHLQNYVSHTTHASAIIFGRRHIHRRAFVSLNIFSSKALYSSPWSRRPFGFHRPLPRPAPSTWTPSGTSRRPPPPPPPPPPSPPRPPPRPPRRPRRASSATLCSGPGGMRGAASATPGGPP